MPDGYIAYFHSMFCFCQNVVFDYLLDSSNSTGGIGRKEDEEEAETSPCVSLDSESKRIFITYEANFTD